MMLGSHTRLKHTKFLMFAGVHTRVPSQQPIPTYTTRLVNLCFDIDRFLRQPSLGRLILETCTASNVGNVCSCVACVFVHVFGSLLTNLCIVYM